MFGSVDSNGNPYENKVNGRVSAGEFLGRDLQFYTVVFSGHDLRALGAGGNATSQAKLDKVIEIVSMNGQPIILGAPAYDTGDTTIKFAIEHRDAWADPTGQDTAADYLAAQIAAHTPTTWGFSGDVTVTISDTL